LARISRDSVHDSESSARIVGVEEPFEACVLPPPNHEMEQPMIRATIRMSIPPKKSDEAQRILRRLVRECGDDPGCLSCHMYGDLQDKDVLVLEQTWKTQESLDLHLRSDVYRNLLLVVEMSLVKPEIRFDTISDSAGIEAIEKARSHS